MAVEVTGPEQVALFCTTSMWAFGPIFESSHAAGAFLHWLADEGHGDPRGLDEAELARLHRRSLGDHPAAARRPARAG